MITKDNVLVIGHGRRLAALKLWCMMPYHIIDKTADELTDEDIRELRIADNQTNAETGLDVDVLKAEIEDLSFDGFDFGLFDIAEDDANDTERDRKEAKYIESISVVIDCESDEEAENIYEHLTKEGYSCRISTL